MSLIDKMKEQVRKSGASKKNFVYFKPGVKVRIRFLQELKDGFEWLMHDSYTLGIDSPCQELFGRHCKHCGNDDLRHREHYAWSVYNYETKEVQILKGAVNNFTPIPQLIGMYETYGTILDRDYVITKNGTQTQASFSVVPMDKAPFKNAKAKPFSKSKALALLDKAWPADGDSGDNDGGDDIQDYSEMSPKQLYDLCQERDIEVKTRQKAEYYVEKLEEWDAENGNADDEWADEPGDDEKPDYSSMTARELYNECKTRDIEVKPKMDEDYYIGKLEEYDADHGDGDGWD